MNTTTITLKTRGLGWGYSTTPTGEDAYSIEHPAAPDYTGTYRQIMDWRKNNPVLRSLLSGGTFTNTAWFYLGRRITHVWGWHETGETRTIQSPDGTSWEEPELREGWIRGDLNLFWIDENELRDGLRIKTM